MDRSRIAIVIPAHNESATIARVVTEAKAYGIAIVVDDASDDGTAAAAGAAGAAVVRNETKSGYDGAINTGFRHADELGMDFVVTLDGDGQHETASIRDVLTELDNGADLVVGYRPRTARLMEYLFAVITRYRYGIFDPLCGLKGYRMELYRQRGHFDRRSSIGTELMLYAVRRGFRFAQVRIDVRERDGHSRFGHTLKGNLKIVRAMLAMHRD